MQALDQRLSVALTIDADADANRPQPGRPDAVSPGGEARFEACGRGLRILAEMTGEFGAPCTIFWTARCLRVLLVSERDVVEELLARADAEHACHGLAHEDFAGRETGAPLGPERTRDVVQQATDDLTSLTGRRPRGFRAPYCRLTPHLVAALRDLDYDYDASLAGAPSASWPLTPRPLEADGTARVVELGLCRGTDRRGRPIAGYLWQLFEGHREAGEYAELIASCADRFPGGLFQLALHPWHLRVDENGAALARDGAGELRALLDAVASMQTVELISAGAYLKRFSERT